MAQTMVGAVVDLSFVNSLRATSAAGGNSTLLGAAGEYVSPNVLRAALNTYDPLTYPTAVLEIMTTNDMVFALRNCKDPKTISDFLVAQTVRT